MAMSKEGQSWEKNPTYPIQPGTCKNCGQWGTVKLAWDLRGYLCLDAKSCINRASKQRPILIMEDSIQNTDEEVVIAAPKSVDYGKLQTFKCEVCNSNWQRLSTRGRPPKVCPSCR